MPNYEYKVVPAPRKGQKGKGVRSSEARFANALEILMNKLGADGWEYQRTDTLPCEERSGLTGKTSVFQNMLVFRRELVVDLPPSRAVAPMPLSSAQAAPAKPTAAPVPKPAPAQEPVAEPQTPTIDTVVKTVKSDATALGGVSKNDPGRTVPGPDVST